MAYPKMTFPELNNVTSVVSKTTTFFHLYSHGAERSPDTTQVISELLAMYICIMATAVPNQLGFRDSVFLLAIRLFFFTSVSIAGVFDLEPVGARTLKPDRPVARAVNESIQSVTSASVISETQT